MKLLNISSTLSLYINLSLMEGVPFLRSVHDLKLSLFFFSDLVFQLQIFEISLRVLSDHRSSNGFQQQKQREESLFWWRWSSGGWRWAQQKSSFSSNWVCFLLIFIFFFICKLHFCFLSAVLAWFFYFILLVFSLLCSHALNLLFGTLKRPILKVQRRNVTPIGVWG